MNDKYSFRERLASIVPFVLVVVYSVVSALTMFLNGDDYVWYYIGSNEALEGFRNPNGRYFSNFITLQIVRYPFFRCVFVSVTLALLIILLAKLIDPKKRNYRFKLCFSLFVFILIPSITYCEVISWISGFTNYVFPVMLTLAYLLMIFRVLFSEKDFKVYHFLIFPVLGLISGLCIEHSAIYDIFLGAAVIILLKWKRKKLYIAPVLYLMFSLTAAYFMFTNKNYSDISQKNDVFGNRQFVFDSADFFMNIMRTIVVYYTKKYWIINAVIVFLIIVLFFRNREAVKKSKYAYICLVISVSYALYSALCAAYSDLVFLSDAMKVRGIEAAFSFLYIVSLAYFVWMFLDKDGKIRAYLYMLSTLLLTGPFTFIDPATARCFFANYVFWMLFCGELLSEVIDSVRPEILKKSVFISGVTAACAVVFILNIEITNRYFNDLRFDFVRQQLESGKKNGIQLIDYPYSAYILDSFQENAVFETDLNEGVTYFSLISEYYGFDGTGLGNINFTHISTSDYFRYISED